ncbi:hypothetical protein PF002_g5892 [Phytophthora fragariae]|uniref:Uncharacterized protein n=1 Tax=Phytophthora fragariae TaxID=53985 RepID=A0A6A3T5W3_9STRA|nr:hypothetical protein PF003_g40693 [Phytophthora fragariae]KAE8944510.1 hypothetical protein PF009_g5811 [Phytophthora fragariae]KAE9130123.1 hypothetical protein PF007_g4641 [Phytophthora fragariae]KAE9145424.1 hypothetical protein PF006_g9718 [Phytophthora fragariae]KAE9248226.1 hypothetical protein PF002_g5892 [Phytophthora fragariae]
MNATKRTRTLLLASRSLPCSCSDAATTLNAAVAHKINTDPSIATPATTTNLAAGQLQLAMLELGRRH